MEGPIKVHCTRECDAAYLESLNPRLKRLIIGVLAAKLRAAGVHGVADNQSSFALHDAVAHVHWVHMGHMIEVQSITDAGFHALGQRLHPPPDADDALG